MYKDNQPILYISKLRLGEIQLLAQDHTARKWSGCDSPGFLTPNAPHSFNLMCTSLECGRDV